MRRQRLQAASASALQQVATASSGAQQQQQQQAGERVSLQLAYADADSSGSAAEPGVSVRLVVQQAEAAASMHGQPPSDLSSALAAIAAAASSGSNGGLDAQLLQQATSALSQLARAQGVALPGIAASAPPTRAASLDAGSADAAASGAAAAAAAADGAAAAALQEQCTQLQLQLGRMQAELEQAQQDAAFARDAAERKQQEMRGRFAEAQQRQGELLRVAQDSRLDAGAWAGWQRWLLVGLCSAGFWWGCAAPALGTLTNGPVEQGCRSAHLVLCTYLGRAAGHDCPVCRGAVRGGRAQAAGGGAAQCAPGLGCAGPQGTHKKDEYNTGQLNGMVMA